MTIDNRISAFVKLGTFLEQFAIPSEKATENDLTKEFFENFNNLIKTVHLYNGWFTETNVREAIEAIAIILKEDSLKHWVSRYSPIIDESRKEKSIAVIMAGNIPMVGFHDMLCVLMSGNKFIGKLSSEDKLLLPFITSILTAIEPRFTKYIVFTEGQIKNMEAVIATGSNNSARYFEYYFGKYPHVIRKNRNSIAVLTGKETSAELKLLGRDIFQYFGLGCRNVSKLFVPEGYTFDLFYESIIDFQSIIYNNKYINNYEYNRTLYLMSNDTTLLDNNFLLLKQNISNSSPIGVLFYEFYDDISALNTRLEAEKENLQCIVSTAEEISNRTAFGKSQFPQLIDYADGVDTMKFLLELP